MREILELGEMVERVEYMMADKDYKIIKLLKNKADKVGNVHVN
jgi:hypothetical protein